jgi:hypothetical protein
VTVRRPACQAPDRHSLAGLAAAGGWDAWQAAAQSRSRRLCLLQPPGLWQPHGWQGNRGGGCWLSSSLCRLAKSTGQGGGGFGETALQMYGAHAGGLGYMRQNQCCSVLQKALCVCLKNSNRFSPVLLLGWPRVGALPFNSPDCEHRSDCIVHDRALQLVCPGGGLPSEQLGCPLAPPGRHPAWR